MSIPPRTTSKNLSIYCQSHSLLFQFTLKEFLRAFKELSLIEAIAKEIEAAAAFQQADLKNDQPYLLPIQNAIKSLTGTTIVNEPHFPWSTDKGSLSKLYHYCSLFTHLCPDLKKESTEMNACARKAFHSAMEIRELLSCLAQDATKGSVEIPILWPLLDKLIDNIVAISHLIVPFISYYKEDENVLFFLLMQREALDLLYKSSFLSDLFQQMYPGGMEEVKEFLLMRYSKRGFHHLLSQINQSMAAFGV